MSCAGLNDELRGDQKRRGGEERATTTPAADTTQVSGRDGAAAYEAGWEAAPTACPRKKVSSRIAWATLLHRAWGWDVLQCPRCDGRMKVIARIQDRPVIVKIGSSTESGATVSRRGPRLRGLEPEREEALDAVLLADGVGDHEAELEEEIRLFRGTRGGVFTGHLALTRSARPLRDLAPRPRG